MEKGSRSEPPSEAGTDVTEAERAVPRPAGPRRRVLGALIGAQAFFFGLFGYWIAVAPVFPVLLFGPAWMIRHVRWWTDKMIELFIYTMTFTLENVAGIRFTFTGDAVPGATELARKGRSKESVLILSNHPTRLDWMYLYTWSVRVLRAQNYKAMLKAPLAAIPGLGWALQLGCLVFLHRKIEDDEKAIDTQFQYYSRSHYPVWMVAFPEGTDLCHIAKAKGQEFARSRGLQVYHHVLHPRTTGLVHAVKNMGKGLDAIYDVTVAFPGGAPSGEVTMAQGEFPPEVVIHSRRWDRKELPPSDNEEAVAQWCKDRFAEKEKHLAEFYSRPERGATPPSAPRMQVTPLSKALLGFVVYFSIIAFTLAFFVPLLPYIVVVSVIAHLYTTKGEQLGFLEAKRGLAAGLRHDD